MRNGDHTSNKMVTEIVTKRADCSSFPSTPLCVESTLCEYIKYMVQKTSKDWLNARNYGKLNSDLSLRTALKLIMNLKEDATNDRNLSYVSFLLVR